MRKYSTYCALVNELVPIVPRMIGGQVFRVLEKNVFALREEQ